MRKGMDGVEGIELWRIINDNRQQLGVFRDWEFRIQPERYGEDYLILSARRDNIGIIGRLYMEHLMEKPELEVERCLKQMAQHLKAGCSE